MAGIAVGFINLHQHIEHIRKDMTGTGARVNDFQLLRCQCNHIDKFAVEYFCNGDAKLKAAMDTIISELHDAKEYGSILIEHIRKDMTGTGAWVNDFQLLWC